MNNKPNVTLKVFICQLKCLFQTMQGGVINKMWKCCNKNYQSDVILLKIFGSNTSQFINRNLEFKIMDIINNEGITAAIYCR